MSFPGLLYDIIQENYNASREKEKQKEADRVREVAMLTYERHLIATGASLIPLENSDAFNVSTADSVSSIASTPGGKTPRTPGSAGGDVDFASIVTFLQDEQEHGKEKIQRERELHELVLKEREHAMEMDKRRQDSEDQTSAVMNNTLATMMKLCEAIANNKK